MRVIELFSEPSMSLGLKQAGFEIVRAYDAWAVAVDTGVIVIRIGRQHRVRVGDDFATETLGRVLSVLRRHA